MITFYATTQAREFLNSLGDLSQTQIFAKIENEEVSEMNLFCLYMRLFFHWNDDGTV